MRAIFEGTSGASVGMIGSIRVELIRTGLPTLSDQRDFAIVAKPPVKASDRRVTIPPFEVRSVDGPDDTQWTILGWPEDPSLIASAAEMENGVIVIYYSTVFPKYASTLSALERRDTALASSFRERYKVWLAAHSLLFYQDQQAQSNSTQQPDDSTEESEKYEREERCRIATLASIFAVREVQIQTTASDTE